MRVKTGAWNTGWHDGRGFVQWTGSQIQKDALAALAKVSAAVQKARDRVAAERPEDGELAEIVERALWHLLRAETSCNFYWGEDWVPRSTADLDIARDALAQIGERLGPAPQSVQTPEPVLGSEQAGLAVPKAVAQPKTEPEADSGAESAVKPAADG